MEGIIPMKFTISIIMLFSLTMLACVSIEEVNTALPQIGVESSANVGESMMYFNRYYKESSARGWTEQIVYMGIANNVITLCYKHEVEFSSYRQEPIPCETYQYTLSDSSKLNEIMVSHNKIRILEANNSMIKYIIISSPFYDIFRPNKKNERTNQH
jgi:hypothetical protein